MEDLEVNNEEINTLIASLIEKCGGEKGSYEADLIVQQIQTSLRFLSEKHNTGQLKFITRAMKEMRYAYGIFNKYLGTRRISFFGSARTPEDHPNFIAAVNFSKALREHGWMCITGAADGIMKAGMMGMEPESAFGLSILLPFESPSNQYLEGDPKLINFRFFFTRKIMFITHSDAVAVFPGGYGTFDELFEMLTLIQTGKSSIIPIVLMEHEDGTFWKDWEVYVKKNLLEKNSISPADVNLYYIASSIEDGVGHITNFYRRYHSSRYVKKYLVLRLKESLNDEQLAILNEKYASLVASGKMEMTAALPQEDAFLDMPRLIFQHTRKDFGLLRGMINTINSFE